MLKLNLKDKKLLYWLDQNSRATNKELGKKVGLTEQAIGYKIKHLQKNGIIKNFVTFINTVSIGYHHYKVFLKLHNTTEEIENNLIISLVNNQNIRWVGSTSGKYDISFSILAQSPLEFSEIYNRIESQYGKHIIEKNMLLNISSPGFTRDFLINGKESKKREYSLSKETTEIDDTDKKILKSISQDARKNIVAIAKETKTTIDIVKYRMKKLKEKDVISGFTIQLDLEKIGYEYYSVFFYTHDLNPQAEKRMLTFAQFHPNILFVVKVLGSHDLQLEFEVKNYAELEANLKDFRKEFANHIRDFEILRVTKEHKYDFFPFDIKN